MPFTIIEDPGGDQFAPKFRRARFDSISTRDWLALLRFYRILRIRIPWFNGTPDMDGLRHSGLYYGMARTEAKATLWEWARELDWHEYLGSK